jgi:hypothetical protein
MGASQLLMLANGRLTHQPKEDIRCWTAEYRFFLCLKLQTVHIAHCGHSGLSALQSMHSDGQWVVLPRKA